LTDTEALLGRYVVDNDRLSRALALAEAQNEAHASEIAAIRQEMDALKASADRDVEGQGTGGGDNPAGSGKK
jgi:hypothetical protein